MSIIKLTPTDFKNKSISFTVLQTEVIVRLKNSDAIAIWAYLCSKPNDWIVRKTDILDTFGIGETRYSRAMKILIKNLLIKIEVEQDEGGRILGKRYIAS